MMVRTGSYSRAIDCHNLWLLSSRCVSFTAVFSKRFCSWTPFGFEK